MSGRQRRDGKLDWFNHQVHEYTGAGAGELDGDRWGERGAPGRSRAGRCCLDQGRTRGLHLRGQVPVAQRAPASIAGIWHAPCRFATRAARSSAGSAPTPTSTIRFASSAPCATARRISRASSRSARSAGWRSISATVSATAFARVSRRSTVCRRKPPRKRTRTGCSASIQTIARGPSGSSSTPSKATCATTTPNTASCARTTDRCAGSRSRPRSSAMRRAGPCVWSAPTSTSPTAKLAELALRESEQRFRLVSESAPVMLWMGDVERQVPLPQPHAAGLLGRRCRRRRPASTGTPRCIPTTGKRLFGMFGAAMRDHMPFTVEARYRRFDGEYRLVRTDAQPRFGVRGEFLGMIGVNVDITESPPRRAGPEGERGAVPPHRQQRAGADVGQPPRRQACVRQPGLHGFPRTRLRRVPRLRLEQGAASRRPAAHSAGADCGRRLRRSRSRWRRAIAAATASGAGCARNRSRAGARTANTSASSAWRTTSRRPSRPKSSCAE